MPRHLPHVAPQGPIAPSVVGSIAPVEITEIEAFDAPTRTVNLRDGGGRLRGRIQWLAEDMGPHSEDALLQFFVAMTVLDAIARHFPFSAS